MALINIQDKYQTYSASTTAFTPAATPTDVFVITGSATAHIYILNLSFSTEQNANGLNDWFLIKRSADNTAGTSAARTAVPHNSNNTAASAVVRQYTANPTSLGTAVGTMWTGKVVSLDSNSDSGSALTEVVSLVDPNQQPIALLSAAEILALNFGGAALPAGLEVLVNVEWIEIPI